MRALLSLTLLALLAGCTTSNGGPSFRLRPEGDETTGAAATGWSGNLDFLLALPDFDDVAGTEFKNNESVGFRISARRASWYVAPEVGYLNTEESNDGVDVRGNEVFAGGRIAARLEELPVELYASGGFSYLDSSVASVDDESEGYYVGGGVAFYLGSEEGMSFGAGYRLVDHDWDFDDWGEFQVHVGFAW